MRGLLDAYADRRDEVRVVRRAVRFIHRRAYSRSEEGGGAQKSFSGRPAAASCGDGARGRPSARAESKASLKDDEEGSVLKG
jgi:hypothetical protein